MKTKVDNATSPREFDEFIDNSFVEICRSRNKVKHKVEFDNDKNEMIFHYVDGTADMVQIIPVENYKPEERYIKIN